MRFFTHPCFSRSLTFKAAILFFACVFQSSLTRAQLVAFPGAEGAGRFTSGGRGTVTDPTTVYEVTSLNDDNSPGTLRYAVNQNVSYRTIVFRVSGTIHLTSRLTIKGNTTIAGQTAPGDGICIADYPTAINGDNVIIRYIRFRMGDKNQLLTSPPNCGVPVAPFTAACMPLDGSGGDDALGDLGHKNIIIDHCTVSWSSDEALTMYRGDSLTLQWNIISEPLDYSYHFETGDTDFEHHGFGGIWGSKNGSFHHNLIADAKGRNPRFAGISTYSPATIGAENADFRNNVIYNWGSYSTNGGDGGNYNLVNNYYKYGPSTSTGSSVNIPVRGMIVQPSQTTSAPAIPYGKFYLEGNYVDGYSAITSNNWLGVSMSGGAQTDTTQAKAPGEFNIAPITTHSAQQAYDLVLQYAGASFRRDTLDQRIVSDVMNRTGRIIDVQGGYPHGTPYAMTVNAWPTLTSTAAPTDSDHDGMPDSYESANGLNLNDPADRAGIAANGYTNLENYLNRILETPAVVASGSLSAFSQVIPAASPSQTFIVSGTNLTGNITITAPANFQVSADGGITWNSNATPLVLPQSSGEVIPKLITVRMNAAAAGSYSGNISVTSAGAETKNVAVTGQAGAASAGEWTVYAANELPNAATPSFSASQQSGSFSNTIVPDPDMGCNSLLQMQTTANSDGDQWRQALPTGQSHLTLVFRAKANSATPNMAFDADLDFGGFRWQTRILTNGTYSVASGTATSGTGNLGVDPTQWNTYRFTKDGNLGTLYVNENPTPVYTATALTAGANNYFRFGDGWGSGFINTYIDWIAWDTTGAYPPSATSLPDSLVIGCNPLINVTSSLGSFSQTVGSPSAAQAYSISAVNLATNLTITPPAGYEVSADAGATWFTNASPLQLSPSNGAIGATNISVRLNASAAGNYAGDITHSSAGATTVAIALSGTAEAATAWTVYAANELPNAFSPVFSASQQSGSFSNTIVSDPGASCNNLLQMQTTANSDGDQWRQALQTGQSHLTLVFRVKGNAVGPNLAFDADLDFGGFRWQTRILTNGSYGVANGTATSGTGSLGIDPMQWNIYRFTKDGNQAALYVNENPAPVYTATAATAGANNYFRFGDGWGSGFINSLIDWVAWDTTGAYSPSQTSLPDSLVNGCNTGAPTINANGALSSFTQIIGSPSGVQTYTVSGSNLTGDITITPPANYEVSGNGGATWFTNAAPLVLPQIAGTVAATTISVRLNATAAGTYTGNITHSSAGANTVNVAVDGTAQAPSFMALTGSLNPFNQIVGTPSASQTYSVEGTGLTQDITVTPPVNYEISIDGGATWFTNASPLVIVQSGGAVPPTTVTVRLNAAATGTFNGDIAHVSAGVTTVNQPVNGTTVPVPSVVVTGTLNAFTHTVGTPSAVQTYAVSGADLAGNVTITPPVQFEVSGDGGTTWRTNSSPLVLTPVSGTLASTTISVRMNASAAGAFSGNIVHASANAPSVDLAVSGTAIPTPLITAAPASLTFTQILGTPSAAQTFTVSGANLVGNITVTPPAGYELSTNGGTSWSSSAQTLTQTGGTVASTVISVRLNASALGNNTGNIVLTSSGAVTKNVAVAGTTIPKPVIVVTQNLSTFSQSVGSAPHVQSYTVEGQNLTDNITVTPPAHFQLSTNNGSTWQSGTLTLARVGTAVAPTTIWLKLNVPVTGTFSGRLLHASSDADSVNITLVGNSTVSRDYVIYPIPAAKVIFVAHPVTTESATLTIYGPSGNRISSLATTPGTIETPVDVQLLPQGLYFLQYRLRDTEVMLKFIKH